MGVLDKLRLDGKVAMVTGAGRGLGRAMAIALAKVGCDIMAAARTRQYAPPISVFGPERGVLPNA